MGEEILDELLSGDWVKMQYAANKIKTMPNLDKEHYVKAIISKLKDDNKDVRENAAVALGKIGDPKAVEPLTAALKDKIEVVRTRAVGALGEIGDPKAVEPLTEALKDTSDDVRVGAAWALGEIGDPEAVEPLTEALEDKKVHRSVRKDAVVALGKIGGANAVEPLISALKDNDRNVCNKAEEALAKIYAPAVEPLIGALKDESAYARANVTRTLGRIGSGIEKGFAPRSIIEDIVNALTKVYKEDPNQGNKEIAKNALDNIKAKQRIERLKRIFGFEEVDEEKYKKSPLNEEAVIRDIAILKTDMNWVKRFMWVIISLIGSLIGGVLIRFLV